MKIFLKKNEERKKFSLEQLYGRSHSLAALDLPAQLIIKKIEVKKSPTVTVIE